jgi:polyphenol oxidase
VIGSVDRDVALDQVDAVWLRPDVEAWFTGREAGADGLATGNLSHHRPHLPSELAAARQRVADAIGVPVASWDLMRQTHGARVQVVPGDAPKGTQWSDCDALVTTAPERALVVLVADCVPLLLAGPRTVAAVHVGWRGFASGVVDATLDAMEREGDPSDRVRAAIGPSIGGCCYEVGPEVVSAVAASSPSAVTRTASGRDAVDMAAAVVERLDGRHVEIHHRVDGCTRCDPAARWFSHRADPGAGRQAGIIVRRAAGDGGAA